MGFRELKKLARLDCQAIATALDPSYGRRREQLLKTPQEANFIIFSEAEIESIGGNLLPPMLFCPSPLSAY
jgi:hypothetical protein